MNPAWERWRLADTPKFMVPVRNAKIVEAFHNSGAGSGRSIFIARILDRRRRHFHHFLANRHGPSGPCSDLAVDKLVPGHRVRERRKRAQFPQPAGSPSFRPWRNGGHSAGTPKSEGGLAVAAPRGEKPSDVKRWEAYVTAMATAISRTVHRGAVRN